MILISKGTSCIVEAKIKKTLVDLMDAIRRTDGDAITTQMALLDGFLEDGRESLHPQLVHFLERHSYPKALMFLGGQSDIPVGSCGGRS